MKRPLITLAFSCASLLAAAQTSGIVQYTETIKMNITTNDEPDAFADLRPKEQKVSCALYFTPQASLYERLQEHANETEKEYSEDNMRMLVKMEMPDEKFYYDFSGQTMTQQREFMGRKFLVEGKKDGSKWKLTGRQKEILEYPCQEAKMKENNMDVTAWFTPVIPVAAGPSVFCGLPGLILEAEVDGIHIFEATAIDLKANAADKIKKPKAGKKMTAEEFTAMMEEKRKELGGDENGNVIIKVRR